MPQGETKNIGQIAAIWIAGSAPDNTSLIWYDTNNRIHKTYEESSGQWVALNPQVVTNSTISTLRTIAQGSGLAVGKFYYLTDVGTLAIAITTTKIWYVDSHGNYIVNDLAASAQYYVNSTNLLIDGATGVWENGQLKFKFTTYSVGSFLQPNSDYVVLRRKTGSVWSWVKCKLQGLISNIGGNSITWNNGLFFNFNNALNAKKNINGGVVGWEQHKSDIDGLQEGIDIATQANQEILSDAKDYTDGKTNDAYIYNTLQHGRPYTLLNDPPEVPGTAAVLHDIITILLSWVKELKKANRISLENTGFNANGRAGDVNYSDNLRDAIEKLVYKTKALLITDGINLPDNFNIGDYPRTLPSAEDMLTTAIGKITKYISDLSGDFESFYRAKFYTYNDGEWAELISDSDYSKDLPTSYIRLKDGLLSLRFTTTVITADNMKYPTATWPTNVLQLAFIPDSIGNKLIKQNYFIINAANHISGYLVNPYYTAGDGVTNRFYSILQVIQTLTLKHNSSSNDLVNAQIAILYEYSPVQTSGSDLVQVSPSGRVLIGLYFLNAANGELVPLSMSNASQFTLRLHDMVYSTHVNSLFYENTAANNNEAE